MYSYYSIWFKGVSTATSDSLSVDFLITRFFYEITKKTSNTNLVKYCWECFFFIWYAQRFVTKTSY